MADKKKSNNKFRNRHIGRILAFQTLFAYEFDKRPAASVSSLDWIPLRDASDRTETIVSSEFPYQPVRDLSVMAFREATDYAKFLIEGTLRNLEQIDEIISAKLRNWELNRISAVDRAVVRFAVFSLLYEYDLDESVIINEAVEIIKEFGAKESYKFVNGILDAIKKDKRQNKTDG